MKLKIIAASSITISPDPKNILVYVTSCFQHRKEKRNIYKKNLNCTNSFNSYQSSLLHWSHFDSIILKRTDASEKILNFILPYYGRLTPNNIPKLSSLLLLELQASNYVQRTSFRISYLVKYEDIQLKIHY